MQLRRILALLGGLGLVVALVLWTRHAEPRESELAKPQGQTSETSETSESTRGEIVDLDLDQRDVPAPAARPSIAHTRQARDELLEALSVARNRRMEAADRPAALRQDLPTAPLNIVNKTGVTSPWEERQLETLRGLLGECYELAAVEEPGLAGTFGLRFSLAAEPDIGGLVEEVSVMEDYSSIANPFMRECMQESLYALELDPPPEGVRVEREITLRFDGE